MSTPEVPERIAEAAKRRMGLQTAKRQRERVEKATERGNLVAAEPDRQRRIQRIQAITGLDLERAKAIAEGKAPEKLGLREEIALGAERVFGKTIDFVGVSFLDRARAAAACVARVIYPDGRPIGSGFLISDRLFLTNNHVLESVDATTDALLEFNYELDTQGQSRPTLRFRMEPQTFFLTNREDDLDFTVVAVGGLQSGDGELRAFGFCPLLDTGDRHILGEYVNIIQHPDGNFKQVVLRENQLVTRLDTVLHYLADTSPGSSGSPVFNDQWEVIALHHYGTPFRQTTDANGRTLSTEMNEGIRISAIHAALIEARESLGADGRDLIDRALRSAERGPSQAHRIGQLFLRGNQDSVPRRSTIDQPDSTNGAPRPTTEGTWTVQVPLEVTIRLVGGDLRAGISTSTTSTQQAGSERAPDRDYDNRAGYDPNFLPSHPVPFPRITSQAPGRPARLDNPGHGVDPEILKYQHFSILMNADRKMAYVTAVNIDGARSRSVNRQTGKARPGIAERIIEPAPENAEATEKWYDEPRLSASSQTSQALYDRQTPSRLFDRGHLVRREDPNWGSDTAAERANADTFHFTNCCPQASPFNQQARLWQGIENYVLDNARAEDAKVSVFTGPVFTQSDPRYRDVRVPQQFYKIVARVDQGRLRVVALLASQASFLSQLPERLRGERFDDLGRVEQYQTSVAEIEDLTGIDFGPLREADIFEASESAEDILRPVHDFEDILLGIAPRRFETIDLDLG